MIEEWRDIEGFEGYYQVSNFGRVKSMDRYVHTEVNGVDRRLIKGKILTLNKKSRYKKIALSKDGNIKRYFVHRLVAQAFIPNPNNYPVVNHKDENPSNNCVDNLEWCTQKHNMNWNNVMRRKVGTKLKKSEEEKRERLDKYYKENKERLKEYKHKYYLQHRELKGKGLKSVVQYNKNGNVVATYISVAEAYEKTGISHIGCACNGRRATAGGYVWKWNTTAR